MTTHSEQTRAGIRAILDPRSIAFIGASDDIVKWGGVLLHVLRKFNYPGAIYPVNPKAETIQGLRAYRSVGDHQGARRQYALALALARGCGWRDAEATMLGNLGIIDQGAGRLPAAVEPLTRAIARRTRP